MILLYILKLNFKRSYLYRINNPTTLYNNFDFLHSRCVLYTSPIIVKVCSICHFANIKLCCTRIFHVVVVVFFLLIIKKDCNFCVSVYCLYKGEDVLS